MRISKIFFPLLAGILGLSFSIFLVISAETFQKCEHDRKSHQGYTALHEKVGLPVHSIVRLKLHLACMRATVGENDGSIVALATIVLAIFTWRLWVSTEKLWIAADAQRVSDEAARTEETIRVNETLRIAEANSVATARLANSTEQSVELGLRAYVSPIPANFILGEEVITVIDQEKSYALVIQISNMGRTPAYEVEVKANWHVVAFCGDLPKNFDFTPKQRTLAPGVFDKGARATIPALGATKHVMNLTITEVQDLLLSRQGRVACYLYGAVYYRDIFKKARTTPFCWVYDAVPKHGMAPFVAYRENNTPVEPEG